MKCKKKIGLILMFICVFGAWIISGMIFEKIGITALAASDMTLEEGDTKAPSGYTKNAGESLDENIPVACALDNSCGDNATWNLTNGTLTISGTGEMYDYSDLAPWYDSRSNITSVVVEKGITKIGIYAFYDCYNLTKVQLPDTLTALSEGSFLECSSLESIILPSGVKEIPTALFAECYSLKTISAPGVISIDTYAFQNTKITSFSISKNLTEISPYAFFNTQIESFNVNSGNSVFSAKDGVLFSDNGKTLFAYPGGKVETTYTIPATVNKIGECAFCKNAYLTQITIPNSVTTLESSAFQECTALTSVTIPNSVTDADNFTFYGCKNLKSLKFGNGLKVTAYEMFEECTSLNEIDFGTGLNEIYARTFAYCSSLSSVTLPANITEISSAAFGECRSLKSFSSYGLTDVPYQAFLNDSALTTVNLNEGVTEIYRYAFGGCTNLKNITLPASVNFVASHAFETFTKITAKNTKLASFGSNGLRTVEHITVSANLNYNYAYEVLEIVNEKRAEAGAPALVMNAELMDTAMQRAVESAILFSHTRPDGSSCFDINNMMYGENLTCGASNASGAMSMWMASEGHRENILNSDYTTIGIGCAVVNGSYYWVQCFGMGNDKADCSKPSNRTVTQNIQIATETFDEATTTSGIIWGELESYTYVPTLQIYKSGIEVGEKISVEYYLKNPGNEVNNLLNANNFIWSSSDTSVAAVSSKGQITGVGAGTAKITAVMKNGFYKISVNITVIDNTLSTPKVSKVENVTGGIKVAWGKVEGAEKYRIYYKTGTGKWTKIADTASTSYTWKEAKSGTKYTFTVRCVSSDGKKFTSNYDKTGKSITYIAAPELSGVSNVNGGVKISWGKVTGAAKYRVYYKAGSGSWTNLADTTATSYTWAGAKSGTKYTFTVRCISSDGKSVTSDYDKTGKSITIPASTTSIGKPTINTPTKVSNGVKVSWSKVSEASSYYVYRRTKGGSWSRLAVVNGGSTVSYTDTTVKAGTTYEYTVRAYDGKTLGDYDKNGKSITIPASTTSIGKPTVNTPTKVSNGVKVSWSKVSGATSYYVYRRTKGGSWSRLAVVNGGSTVSYTDTTVKAGTTYEYTVRAYDGKTLGDYDKTGKSITIPASTTSIGKPTINTPTKVSNGVKVSWSKVSGANSYYVYRRTKGGSWSRLAVVNGDSTVSYTDTTVKAGTTYEYTVRAYDGKTLGDYDKNGKSITIPASTTSIGKPTINTPTKVSNGVKVSWSKVSGASSYYVYRRTKGGSWSRLAVVNGGSTVSYTDTTVKAGTTYEYTVRAYDGKTLGDYDKNGKSITVTK